jgi:hypothetical protein
MVYLIIIQKYFLHLHLNFNIIIINMNRIKEILNEKGIKQTWLVEKLGKSF